MNEKKTKSKKDFFYSLQYFIKEKIKPYFIKWDEVEEFPKKLFEKMIQGGYLSTFISNYLT